MIWTNRLAVAVTGLALGLGVAGCSRTTVVEKGHDHDAAYAHEKAQPKVEIRNEVKDQRDQRKEEKDREIRIEERSRD